MSIYAVDFGTSNSLLTYVSSTGEIRPVKLDPAGGHVLRSLLFTPQKNAWFFGSEAIKEYVNHEGEGRFLRSIKKFLPEPGYTGTAIHNQNVNISEMIAVFLTEMRRRANLSTGEQVERIVLGRPALYSLDKDHDQLAQDRMQKAAEIAGFKEIHFCPEPVAAGLDYQNASLENKIVLIADFGGGTSDFTLMRGPEILGLSGVFLAGDALDGDMMKDFIAPHFGSQFEYQLPGGQNVLKFPRGLLKKICSPAHITHLREKDTWEFLQHIGKFALSEHDEKYIQQLYALVEGQLGFPLFNEIEKTKIKLGKSPDATFVYQALGIDIEQPIDDQDYRISVRPTVDEIISTMLKVFEQSGVMPTDVTEVILTGGTSQFPLLRERLTAVFGAEKLREHNIYESVVNGLAHFAKGLLTQK